MRNEDVKDALPRRDECVHMHRFCLSMNLRRTERLVTAHYDRYLAGAGLTAVQLPILAALTTVEEPTFRALAETLELDRSTLSRNLALLAERGLVEIVPSSGRTPGSISLTRKGRRTLARAHRLWLEAHEALSDAVSPAAVNKALRALQRLRQTVRAKTAE